MAKASVSSVQLQHDTERTVYVTWTWSKNRTDHYEVKWLYATGDGVGFVGSRTTTESKQSTYDAPQNATHVAFYVKPVSKTYKSNDKDVHYWTADWSTVEKYYFSDNPPSDPPTPSVEIENYTLTAKVDNVETELYGTHIEFQVVKDDTKVFDSGKAKIVTNSASYTCTVLAGSEYKVRCRGVRDDLVSEWSDYSAGAATIPASPSEILELRALSETSVYLDWSKVATATSYEIERATQKSRFDSSSDTTTSSAGSESVSHAEISGLESGQRWYFRVRAVNDQGSSAWTDIKSVRLGTAPSAPTTWSSTATAMVGEKLILYWTHNSEDGSNQHAAKVEFTVGSSTTTHKILHATSNTLPDEAAKVATTDIPLSDFSLSEGLVIKLKFRDGNNASTPTLNLNETGAIPIQANGTDTYKWSAGTVVMLLYNSQDNVWSVLDDNAALNTTSYSIDTSSYPEGTKIKWRVQTRGIMTEYSPWSVERTVDIYAPPVVDMEVTDSDGNTFETLTTFPFYVTALAGPNTQTPIGYSVSIIANETHETVDNIGNTVTVKAGEEVYSNYFDISGTLMIEISAGVLSLENNVSYTIKCVASMNSGLTAEASSQFNVAWSDVLYWPDLEIGYDDQSCSAIIRPYCVDDNGSLVEGVTLSVYRREFDGSFILLASGIDNLSNTYLTDPHPSLDFARYRVVATANSTGAVSYYDVPGYPVGEKAAIVQWDEEWTSFDVTNEDVLEQPTWSGSMLRLPYNIDVSDSHDSDVELVKYIGRKNPVAYYGTQRGKSSSWNMSVPKSDKETLYALRRLSEWMGDVYVREPSGSGYWANVTVSFSQKHCDLIIPVSMSIVRVEGGI